MSTNRPQRILFIKLSDIGDVLTATPALRVLRESFPGACIDVLVPPRSAPVLRGLSSVDEIIIFDKFVYDSVPDALSVGALRAALSFFWSLRARHYDTLLLPHHLSTRWGALKWAALALAPGAHVRVGLDNGRGWFLTQRVHDAGFGVRHEVEHCLAVAGALGAATGEGIAARDCKLEIDISGNDRRSAAEQLAPLGGRPYAVLHPGSGGHSLARRWPLERWAQVGQALAQRHGLTSVIVGTTADGGDTLAAQLPAALNLTGRTTLAQLAAVLQGSAVFAGADSGVMHIAAAAGARVAALFGTTNPKAWRPWCPPGRSIVVQSETPGCPCAYVGFDIRSDACEARECMLGIAVEAVVAAIERLLDE